ncbi:Shedu immune nuclease family protein [Serratia sp. IR-2025]
MIDFRVEGKYIVLEYNPEIAGIKHVYEELEKKLSYTIAKTFHLSENELLSNFDEEDYGDVVEFVVAEKEGSYYKFRGEILGLDKDVFIHKEVNLSRKTFVAERRISIFKKIGKITSSNIYIGGNRKGSIPYIEFKKLISKFPNTYELDRYALARVESVISSYIDSDGQHEKSYHDYLNKKIELTENEISNQLADYEEFKYKKILEKLKRMLKNEEKYSEKQWQSEILDIILLLYPKYLYAFNEAKVKDFHSKKNRFIDYLLIDSSGNIDIIEIKKPFDKCIVTENEYRDNYIPLRELSGTVMQIEKYIFHLSKSGDSGEKKLTQQFKNKIPDGFEIKITNPGGFIIMGRKSNLRNEQLHDFEIIKRKYKNLIDILTYDDLIERLEFILNKWSEKK